MEGASWPWDPFEFRIHVTNNDAGVQKDDDGFPREEFLNGGPGLRPGQRYLNGPCKGGRFRAAYLGRQILARRTGLYVLKNIVGCCPVDVTINVF